MESKEIMIKSEMPKFKGKALNEATAAIYEAVNRFNTTAAETRKTVAVVLARVERHQSYKSDGFKSLAEYAEQIGLDKSLAHKLENAGRLLDSKDEAVRNFANNTDYSKLAIVSSAGEDAVKAAVAKGELKPENTQTEVRAWKDAHNAANAKVKVVPTWHITGESWCGRGYDVIDVTIGIQSPKDWAREFDGTLNVTNVKVGEDTVYLATNASGLTIRYTAVKVEKPKAKPTKAAKTLDPKSLSDEQLAAMIAEYNARRKAEAGE